MKDLHDTSSVKFEYMSKKESISLSRDDYSILREPLSGVVRRRPMKRESMVTSTTNIHKYTEKDTGSVRIN